MLQLAEVLANCIVEANETYAYCEGLLGGLTAATL